MDLFKDRGDSMGRFRCVTLAAEGQEKCLAGPRGEIWESGIDTYSAFVVLPSGDEKIYRFSSKELSKWVSNLKVPADPTKQAVWANDPNRRQREKKSRD